MGVLLALAFWILEASIHAFAFMEGNFFRQLIPQELKEVWSRSTVCCLFIAFGFYAHFAMMKLKESERKREILQKQIEASLTKILNGFLPICANCKKIRDDHGNWEPIEGYIQSHTEAKFTHGVCPECAIKLYPQFVKCKT